MKTANPGQALANVRATINKIFKAKSEVDWGEVAHAEDDLKRSLPHLPTGSVVVDYLIGGALNKHGVAPCPGIPRGKFTQLWGAESAGKSTLALTLAATTCAAGGTVVYFDFEHEIVLDYASSLGVPIGNRNLFMLIQPDSLEDGLKMMSVAALSGVDLIVIDSVGAAVPKAMADRKDEEMGDQSRPGLLAQKWSESLPILKGHISKSGTAVLGISQVRDSVKFNSNPNADTRTIQGGNAWKFYSALRMEMTPFSQEKLKGVNAITNKVEELVTGTKSRIRIKKCKVSSSQGREQVIYLRWGEGIDDLHSIIDIAVSRNVITRAGSWLTWTQKSGEAVRAQGVEQFRTLLIDKPSLQKDLLSAVMPYLAEKASAQEVDGDEDEEEDSVFLTVNSAYGEKPELD